MFLSSFAITAQAIQPGEDTIASKDTLTREEVITKAVDAFPEHESKIRGEYFSTQQGSYFTQQSGSPELIISESRMLSENEIVTYQEYSNSIIFSSYILLSGKTITESANHNGFTHITMDVYLTCSASEDSVLIEDVKCNYRPGTYSQITSTGTAYKDILGLYPDVTITAYQETGTSTSPAYVEYHALFELDVGLDFETNVFLLVEVSPSGITVSGNWISIE